MGTFPADSRSWSEAVACDPLPTDIEMVRESSCLGVHGPAALKAGRFDTPVKDKVGTPLPDWDPRGSRHQALMMPALRGEALALEYQEVIANGRCQGSPGTEFEISSKISLSPEVMTPEGPHLETGPGEPLHPVVSVVRKDVKLRGVQQDAQLPHVAKTGQN